MMAARYNRLQTIALNTFREAVRQKFFGLLIVLALCMVASATFFLRFDFGGSELKFIADFGWGAVFLFGSVLAIVATAQLFFSEIENRTAMTLLAKPVPRWEFLLGKLGGILMLLAVFTGVLVVLLMGIVYLHESAWMEIESEGSSRREAVSYAGFALMGVLQFIKFSMLSAITLFICSFSNTNLYSVILSFLVMLICQLQYIARDYWGVIDSLPLRYFVMLLGRIFPNFQLFNAGDALLFGSEGLMPMSAVLSILGYGCIYVAFFYLMSVWSFRKREI